MEVICFGIGLIAGLLAGAKSGGAKAPRAPKEEEIPPELMKQYEELFGYDGSKNEM